MTTVSEGDRELLELAAKAAGYEAVRPATFGMGCWMALSEGEWQPWDPLTDDGDAFRLAVKLGLSVTPLPIHGEHKTGVMAKLYRNSGAVYRGREKNIEEVDAYEGDPYAATRRAVVRAAASIGKSQSNGRS